MTLIEKLQEWKKDLEELSIEKGKAEGRYEQALSDLKELGYDSIEDAQKELEKLSAKKKTAESEALKLLELFKEKYAGFIE